MSAAVMQPVPVVEGIQVPPGLPALMWPVLHPAEPLQGGYEASATTLTFSLYTRSDEPVFWSSQRFGVRTSVQLTDETVRLYSDPLPAEQVQRYFGAAPRRGRRSVPVLRIGLRVPTTAIYRLRVQRRLRHEVALLVGFGLGSHECDMELAASGAEPADALEQAARCWLDCLASTYGIEGHDSCDVEFPTSIPILAPTPRSDHGSHKQYRVRIRRP